MYIYIHIKKKVIFIYLYKFMLVICPGSHGLKILMSVLELGCAPGPHFLGYKLINVYLHSLHQNVLFFIFYFLI